MSDSAHPGSMDFDRVRISLASPADVRGWSSGEVTHADFTRDALDKPHPDGLFSERIFGPLVDWCCGCRLREQPVWHGPDKKGQTCPRCHVCVDESLVRRKRMGHVNLAVPIVHTWFLRSRPSPIALLLDLRATELQALAAGERLVVLDPGDTELSARQLIDDLVYLELRGRGHKLTTGTGGRAIQLLLRQLELDEREQQARAELELLRWQHRRPTRQRDLARVLQLVAGLRGSGNKLEWMVLECLPVLPPDLRPLRELPRTGTRYCSDLNLFYENIIRTNNRLRELQERGSPSAVLRDQARLLQRHVDALLDNARCDPPITGASRRPLRSLTDLLQGKTGRFRQNLLGKRVDFSARAVIVAGPRLNLGQCGLPRQIAEELFRPHLLGRLARSLHDSLPLDWPAALRAAFQAFAGRDVEVRRTLREAMPNTFHDSIEDWLSEKGERLERGLRELLRDNLVLLNRAPSLHRMNVQAFQPVLHEGKTILLHPLACEGFGADFDGDTMAVHLPLCDAAQDEADRLMRPLQNLLSPASGRMLTPSNEIVLGCAYLTADSGSRGDTLPCFVTFAEVILAHSLGKLGLHSLIQLRLPHGREVVGTPDHSAGGRASTIVTTAGRVLFNDILPEGMPYYDMPLTRKALAGILGDCFRLRGRLDTACLLDRIKDIGIHFATRSGLSFVVEDLLRPANKDMVVERTRRQVEELRRQWTEGRISERTRYRKTIALWQKAEREVTDVLVEEMKHDVRDGRPYLNPLYLMAQSGARSRWVQVRQLAGMRGLMARPSTAQPVVEHAITSSLREGLSMLEFWVSTHGARKAGADKDALPESGDLTRKLVDATHHVVVRVHDCGTTVGRPAPLESLRGRISLNDVRGPEGTLLHKDELIGPEAVRRLREAKVREVAIRSPMTCAVANGICQMCYGTDLTTNALVALGTPVGVLAAQSIGEPGTQLAMKTKHTGGIVTGEDMVNDLERVKALLEARAPRRPALLAECEGVVSLRHTADGEVRILVRADGENSAPWVHGPAPARGVLVRPGQHVQPGEVLTKGDPWPDDLLRLCGIEAVRRYFLEECQAVYRRNGVALDDRHFEVVLARVLGRWRIEESGDTELAVGMVVDWAVLVETNRKLLGRVRITESGSSSTLSVGTLLEEAEYLEQCRKLTADGKVAPLAVSATPAAATPLGLKRAAMEAGGFLSAASFQHTRQVLMEAALAGKVDELLGLKENVLLGRLIPAGTGFPAERDLAVDARAQD